MQLRTVKSNSLVTERERQVISSIADGESSKQTGAALGISDRTAEHHASAAMEKLGARNRAHMVAIALRNGLIASLVAVVATANDYDGSRNYRSKLPRTKVVRFVEA